MHIIVNSRGEATVMDDVTIPMSTLARLINDWVPNGPARRALFLELSVILKDHNPEFTRSEFMSLCRASTQTTRNPAGWANPPITQPLDPSTPPLEEYLTRFRKHATDDNDEGSD